MTPIPPSSLRRVGDGLLIGLVIGGMAGAVDQLLRILDPTMAWSPSAWAGVAALHAIPMALVGGVLALWTRRLVVTLGALALLIVLGGWVNIVHLPSLFAARSLAFDAAALTACLAAIIAGHRWPIVVSPGRMRATMASFLGVLVVLAVLVPRWGSAREGSAVEARADESAPDILVVLLDALRADHCSCYGYERDTTPNLDALAATGVRFDRVYSPSSWTKPVVASLFTGMHPASHRNHRVSSGLPRDVATVPELLRRAGYHTAVFAENNFVSRLFGFDRGVDHFAGLDPDVPAQTVVGHLLHQIAVRQGAFLPLLRLARGANALDPGQAARAGEGLDVVDAFTDWVGELPADRPVYAYVHLMKPHAPYVAPAPFDGFFGEPQSPDSPVDPPHMEGLAPFAEAEAEAADPDWVRRLLNNYDERLRYGDHLLGEVVKAMRDARRSRDLQVVVLADHGEEFGENGLFDHGHSLQEGVVRVPLVLSGPAFAPDTVVTTPVRLLDLPPTLLALAGADLPSTVQGRDLALLLASSDTAPRPVVAEVEHGPGYFSRALVSDALKLVVTEQNGRHAELVFDLEADPAERQSIARPGEDPLVWLKGDLERFLDFARSQRAGETEMRLDPAAEERLRALGYIE